MRPEAFLVPLLVHCLACGWASSTIYLISGCGSLLGVEVLRGTQRQDTCMLQDFQVYNLEVMLSTQPDFPGDCDLPTPRTRKGSSEGTCGPLFSWT